MDRYGHHALICKAGPVNIVTRHNRIRDTIYDICQEVNAEASKEQAFGRLTSALSASNDGVLDENEADRPADVKIENWLQGAAVIVDVSICNAHLHESVAVETFDPKATFHLAANRKNDRSKNQVRALGLHFLPFVMGSLGGFCPDAVQVLNFLSQKWELKFNTRASHALSLLRRRFALVLQKCQAAQIIDRGILAEVLA